MVAYSFQKRFAPSIQDGSKTQTIRAGRKRHAWPDEKLQLYCGMRTKHCFKIIPDPTCTYVMPISIKLTERRIREIMVEHEIAVPRCNHDEFSVRDGFENIEDMHDFWVRSHGVGTFHGYVIGWDKSCWGVGQ